MKRVMVLGATGAVGSQILAQALASKQVEKVIAVTRRAIPEHPKLINPVVEFDNLPEEVSSWQVDAVVCALGSTLKKARSYAAFRCIDHDYVISAARLARNAGCTTFVYNSALGANPNSWSFYLKMKGEVEHSLRQLGFPSLTLVRPSILDAGKRADFRLMEAVGLTICRLIEPLLPQRWRPVKTDRLAECMLRAALNGELGVRVIESESINRAC